MLFDTNTQTLTVFFIYQVAINCLSGFFNIQSITFALTFVGYILCRLNSSYNFLRNENNVKNFFSKICLLFYSCFCFSIVKNMCLFVFYFGFIETITTFFVLYSTFSSFNINIKFISDYLNIYCHKLYSSAVNLFNFAKKRFTCLYNVFYTTNSKENITQLKNTVSNTAINFFIPSQLFSEINGNDTLFFDQYKNKLLINNNMEFTNNEAIDNVVDDNLDDSDDEDSNMQQNLSQPQSKQTTQQQKRKMLREKINQKKNSRTGNISKNSGGLSGMEELFKNEETNKMMQNMLKDDNFQAMFKNMTGGTGKLNKKNMEKMLDKLQNK